MTDDLAAFITARLDEDEATAKAAGVGDEGIWGIAGNISPRAARTIVTSSGRTEMGSEAEALHAASHDPARALREVEAKRRILYDHTPQMRGSRAVCSRCHYGNPLGANWPCLTIESLAAIWSDHPGYRAEWKP